ncbi:MAG: FAD-dependent oxidoreductase [Candidatus Nanopelagicales bacterium]
MADRLVVVGGGAAGMSAASAARRADPDLAITVLETSPFPSFGVCGLPYYLSGVVPEAESLVAHPVAEYRGRRRIDLRLETPVVGLDIDRGLVELPAESLAFDRLVLASGARPLVPALPGVDHPRVVSIRRLDDAIALRRILPDVRRAVVVGAGYVGLEMAESLHHRGIDVTVVDRLDRVMVTVDREVAQLAQAEVERHATVLLGRTLTAIEPAGTGLRVHTDQGAPLIADLVVLALGVVPQVDLLREAGAETGPGGALLVDDRMRTSLPGVLAAGDCVAVHHRVLDAPAYVPLGPAANKAGRVAGTVAAGRDARFEGVMGTAVVKVFDLTVAHTGIGTEQAAAVGIEAVATDVTARSRAKYYPGAEPLLVRLVHTPEGRLLGAQLAGRDGAAQRIDVVVAALQAGFHVADLAALDLAYAPPFSPVYDPLTQAAQAALRSRPAVVAL